MNHIALLGDSIFDNERYVPGGPCVIEHLRRELPSDWKATLLAFDGAITNGVERQLAGLPADCTHLAISVGGNDALGVGATLLNEQSLSMLGALSRLADVREEFQRDYQEMLRAVLKRDLPTVVCTIYDDVPGLGREELTALCLFNDIILREAFRARVPVIDLRMICTESTDYAKYSPIEPSAAGGGKVARAVRRVAMDLESLSTGSRVFCG